MTDSHYNDYDMQDNLLPHSLCDGHLLVLCIGPYSLPFLFFRSGYFKISA